MMSHHAVQEAVFAGLALACYTDLRTMRIPNSVTVGMMLFGLGGHTVLGHPLLPWVGVGAAFAVHYPLWLLKIERGGDAKLMMGVGALLGWSDMLEATLWYAVLYLPVGLAVLTLTGNLGNLVRTLRHLLYRTIEGLPPASRDSATAFLAALRIPVVPVEAGPPTWMKTAPVIAAATVCAYASDMLALWS